MQIYKDMDIGTAKPTKDEQDGINHYLLDFIEPDKRYSVADYKRDAEVAINNILEHKKVPIIVGGTGLYVDSLIYNIQYPNIEFDDEYRKKLELIVQNEGSRKVSREVAHYNLQAIIAVGFKVNNQRAVRFRVWANQIVEQYTIKGWAMDEERLKNGGTVLTKKYFEEQLERIREIRISERNFYQKLTDIYATSLDYDRDALTTKEFFAKVQNKMHWAAHKHTAAEVIYQRADAEKDNMGLTSWASDTIRRSDVEVAKNYLTQQELDALNKIVTAYLDIAEVHALNQEPMYMKDWLETIDDYLKMTRRDILTSSGHISHKQALDKAHSEYTKYKNRLENTISPVEQDFIKSIGTLEEIADFGNK